MQRAVIISCGSQLFDSNLITSGSHSLQFGLNDQLVITCSLCHQRCLFLSLQSEFRIELQNLLAVRSRYLHHDIDTLLLDDRLQELIGAQPELVLMPLPTAQFTLDRMPLLERADIFLIDSAILRAS